MQIRSPQDLAGGVFMIALAAVALVFSNALPVGSLADIGPGMLPRSLAVICGLLGATLAAASFRFDGEKLSGWSWPGVALVLGGACLFAATIRGFELGPLRVPELGLLVSGPLVIFYSGLAAPDRRLKELAVFAIAMSMACILLFKYALGLSIPLAPWLLGI